VCRPNCWPSSIMAGPPAAKSDADRIRAKQP
jgi:hypothetical protein